ncbi:hypothetical protein ACFO25_14720 [Paenactinomyces guangxiensis]|nr:hypothetical protein [Paenactinomyces guangxiensis]
MYKWRTKDLSATGDKVSGKVKGMDEEGADSIAGVPRSSLA